MLYTKGYGHNKDYKTNASKLLIKNTSMYTVKQYFFGKGKMTKYIFSITWGLYGDTVPLKTRFSMDLEHNIRKEMFNGIT